MSGKIHFKKTNIQPDFSKNDAIAEARGLIDWVLESAICEESAYRIVQENISKLPHVQSCYI